jgi:acyl carrier protein
MQAINGVIQTLAATLQLPDQGKSLTAETELLGNIPEFDSMAVVTVITSLEELFGIFVEDDEISAETFETVGSLARFIDEKLSA